MSQIVTIAQRSAPSARVVFVHGLNGHAYGTWGDRGEPASYWPLWLAGEIPGLDVLALSYEAPPTTWLGTSMPLEDRVSNVLEQLLAREDLRELPLAFICHSLGGLIIKQVLLDLAQQRRGRPQAGALFDRIAGVVFVATPHLGSDSATWLERLRFLAWPSDLTRRLVANDPTLRKLNVSYRLLAQDHRETLRHLVFYETQATEAGGIVGEGSADPGLPGDPPVPIDATHLSICKPADRTSLVYRRTVGFLASLLPTAAEPGELTVHPEVELPAPPRVGIIPLLVRVAGLLVVAGLLCVAGATIWTAIAPATPAASTPSAVTVPTGPFRLAGRVLDGDTHQPLEGVQVELPALKLTKTTGPDGVYDFQVDRPYGTSIRVNATRAGYQPYELNPEVGTAPDHEDILPLQRLQP